MSKILTAEQYAIKRFETTHNEKINFLKEWQEHSLKLGLVGLTFVLNEYNWKELKGNHEKVIAEFKSYLFALGYKQVNWTYPAVAKSPDGKHMSGYVIIAYPEIQEVKKKV